MIIDLTEQNKVLAAACRQADANAMVDVLRCYWSANGGRYRRFLDEDEIFIASEYDCCITNPSMLLNSRKNGKHCYVIS